MTFDHHDPSAVLPPIDPALNRPDRIVVVASVGELRRRSHYMRLAIATGALPVSRRELINVVADAIYGFKGKIVWPTGQAFAIPYVDDAFGSDGSFRWVSDFLRFAEEGPRQMPQKRIMARLRLIDLYFRIKHPERARLIAE
jgi:hypothetical protein